MSRIFRVFVALALVVISNVTAGATQFIKEVKLIGGSKADILGQIITFQNQGWSFIDKDLNDNAGGDYILLMYKLDSATDGFDYGGNITGFYISNQYSAKLSYESRTYYPVPCAGGEDFTDGHGDLNEGCGQSSAYIYLYYTRDSYPDRKIVTGITFNSSQSGGVGLNGGSSGYDLNSGAGGDFIYMHLTRTKPSDPIRIGEGTAGTNTLPFFLGNSNYPYSISQQIYTAEDIGTAGSIKAISFLHRLSDMSLSMNGVKVYMKHTDKNLFTGVELDPADGFVQVFEGSVSATGSEWMTIRLDTPFEYDGNSNLMVCCYNPAGVSSTGNTFTYHNADNMMRRYASHDPFNWEGTLMGSANTTMRNDIRLNIVPSQFPHPVKLKLTAFTDKGASVSWSAPEGSHPAIQRYEWQYKLSDATDWSALSSTTETSASISGLSAFTEYLFRVKVVYNSGESSYSILRFVTAVGLPYDCGFENGMPGWSQVDYNHYLNIDYTGISEEARHDGDYGYRFRCYDTDPVPQYLISPGLPSDKEIAVSFYYSNYAASSPETFQVGYSTSTSDVSAFTWGDSVTATGTEWWQYQNSFPVGTQYVAVKYSSNNYFLFLDDFEFVVHSSYPRPTRLSVSELGVESVSLKWTAPDAATGYMFQYKRADESNWSSEASASGTSVKLSGLSANTLYDFRVKALFDSNASNFETLRFQTEGPMESLPHTQDFENGMGGWRLVDGYGRTGITTREHHEGSYSFEFDEGSPHAQFLRSPLLEGGCKKVVSFYFKNYSEEAGESVSVGYQTAFQVGWSTNSYQLSDFVATPEQEAVNGRWTRYSLQVPEDTKYVLIMVKDHKAWLYVDDISITEVPQPEATLARLMGGNMYVTTFYDSARKWQLPEGALAYTVNKEGEDYVFYCVNDVIRAGTPVVIVMDKSEGDTGDTKVIEMNVTSAAGTAPHLYNVLQGTDVPIAVTDGKIGDKTVYVLSVVDGKLGFYKFSGSVIPAGKAYILED